jgi:hypothetical protein
MKQLSKEQAHAVFQSKIWETWSDIQLLRIQLFQEHLCMPFGRYHRALERHLGRPVYTTSLDYQKDKLIKEVLGTSEVPTSHELYALIPAEVLNAETIETR